VYIGFEALRLEVRRQLGQTRRGRDQAGIQRVHWLDVTIDGQTTDQTIGSERFARTDQPCKVRRTSLGRQFVHLNRSHNSTLSTGRGAGKLTAKREA
jgi:hypothetical protein